MIPISVNRYALVCRPFAHNAITSGKSTLIQITTLSVFVLFTGIFELYKGQTTRLMYKMCFFIISVVISVSLPLIVTLLFTFLIICELRRKTKNVSKTVEDSASTVLASTKCERKKSRAIKTIKVMTRAIIATNLAFIILTLPSTVLRVIWFFFKLEHDSDPYWNLAITSLTLLSDINFSINIFIYTLYLSRFRSTLWGFFTCHSCRES